MQANQKQKKQKPIINSVSCISLCVLSNPRRNEKFPHVPCQFFCVFYLTLGDMRNFPVCHVNFPVFHLTHREMLNFPMGFDIFLCVLSKSTWKCAFPCVCMKKPSGKFGTHRDILVSSSRFHKKSEALVKWFRLPRLT